MTSKKVIIIGGGIHGAGIARDAALRGFDVKLFEKGDFCSGTSWASSRLIHGGLRYLEFMEFDLVRESLRERETLFRIAKELVSPIRMVIPVYPNSKYGKWKLTAGMFLYDAFSWGKSVTGFAWQKNIAQVIPRLRCDQLEGAMTYYDGQCVSPEKLVMANLLSASESGAEIFNYHSVQKIIREKDCAIGVVVRDENSGNETEYFADVLVNAGGPWLDKILLSIEREPVLGNTKGTHIVISNAEMKLSSALYLPAFQDGRPFFIIPWLGYLLVGTTDLIYEDNPDTVKPSREEIDYLIREVNYYLPQADLSREKIMFSQAGVRPLLRSHSSRTAGITRRHKILDHEKEDGLKGMISIAGGKLTTYRHAAEETVDWIERKLEIKKPACQTADLPISDPGFPNDETGIREAIRKGLAKTLADVMWRRTTIGIEPKLGLEKMDWVSGIMAKELNWDETRKKNEMRNYAHWVQTYLCAHFHGG